MAADRTRLARRALVALTALAALAATSCAREANVTHLRVQVEWEAPVEIDQLRFEVARGVEVIVQPSTRPESPGAPLTSPSTVAILLPERAVGQSLSLRVAGLRNGVEVTSGRADGVTPLPDRGVDVQVRLGRRRVAVRIDPSPVALPMGLTQQFTAQAVYSDDTLEDVTEQATWSSSNPGVASVDTAEGARGLVTAVAMGSATISATVQGLTGQSVVTVGPVRLVSAEISPNPLLLPTGMSRALHLSGTNSDGTSSDLSSMAEWSTSDPSVAAVGNSASDKGLVTGLQPGAAVITARAAGFTAQANVVVVVPTLQKIVVSPSSERVAIGFSVDYTATGIYSDGQSLPITSSVTWSSSDPSKATISPAGRLTGVAAGDVTVTASLQGVTGSTTATITSAALTLIMVTPTNPTVPKGTPIQMVATGVYNDGSTLPITSSVAWASSDNAVATVNPQGVVNPVAAGSATITATLGSVSATSRVTVTNATLSTIMVQPGQLTLPRNARQALKAIGQYSDGSTSDLTTLATWGSSSTAVARVSTSGEVTAVMPGSADVTATFGARSGTSKVTVSTATLTAVEVSPASATIQAGAEVPLKAAGRYSDGTSRDVTAEATWTTSDAAIAQVGTSGVSIGRVAGVGAGTATITATLDGVAGTSTITVNVVTVTAVALTPASPAITVGATQQLTCTATYSDMSSADVTGLATWSTSAAAIAQVSNADGSRGQVTGVAPGTSTIGCALGGQSASTTLTVSSAALRSITVSPASAKLARGTARQYRADGFYSDGRTRDVTALASWTTSDAAIAQVTSDAVSRGRVSGVGAGTATITATVGGVSGATTVQVTTATVTSIAVTPADAALAEGTQLRYAAVATFSDATTQDLTDQVTWSSSDTRIATISGAGLAQARKKGSTIIGATFATITGTTRLTVRMASLQSIAITPATPSVAVGRTVALKAIATFTGGLLVDITEQAAWSSGAASVASVGSAAGSYGVATGVSVGSATITAALGGRMGMTTLSVTAPVFDSVVVTPPSTNVAVNATAQLTATAYLSDQTTQMVTTTASWMSSNTGVVTVNDGPMKGLCRGVANGTATITASAGGVSGQATVSVP
jgi:uncharacterized protein YjdB